MMAQIAERPGFIPALFSAGIAVAVTDPQATHHRALAQEYDALAKCADKRLRDFAAGRAAAHTAMKTLNVAVRPVLPGPDRAPIWPDGVVGSISHSKTCCIAALAPSNAYLSIGVDVEEDTPLNPDLFTTICTPAERAWLAMHSKPLAGRLAKLIFSAKECAYKCQYPLTQTLFDFDTFELTPDLDTGQFDATFTRAVGRFAAGDMLSGRFAMDQGLIVTAMSVRI